MYVLADRMTFCFSNKFHFIVLTSFDAPLNNDKKKYELIY